MSKCLKTSTHNYECKYDEWVLIIMSQNTFLTILTKTVEDIQLMIYILLKLYPIINYTPQINYFILSASTKNLTINESKIICGITIVSTCLRQ